MSNPDLIVIGSDHAGWPLKEVLVGYLRERGFRVEEVGPRDRTAVDYPDVAVVVGRKVASGEVPRGILICGTGLGMSIAANKVPGVRACLCYDTYMARMSRAHNDCNILVLGGRVVSPLAAQEILSVWLETDFDGGRHQNRLDKITRIEHETNKGDAS
jgi:ribose 5-phosphate isomerase B